MMEEDIKRDFPETYKYHKSLYRAAYQGDGTGVEALSCHCIEDFFWDNIDTEVRFPSVTYILLRIHTIAALMVYTMHTSMVCFAP